MLATDHQFDPSAVSSRLDLGQEAICRYPITAAAEDADPIYLEDKAGPVLALEGFFYQFSRAESYALGGSIHKGAILAVSYGTQCSSATYRVFQLDLKRVQRLLAVAYRIPSFDNISQIPFEAVGRRMVMHRLDRIACSIRKSEVNLEASGRSRVLNLRLQTGVIVLGAVQRGIDTHIAHSDVVAVKVDIPPWPDRHQYRSLLISTYTRLNRSTHPVPSPAVLGLSGVEAVRSPVPLDSKHQTKYLVVY
jgi:hypothetical protein